MSIFQCGKCGCAENTATGWYWARNSPNLTKPEELGLELCSACAPQQYPNGDETEFTGVWHGIFKRTFLPHGSCFTNDKGNLEHKETGLVGNKLYDKYGSVTEYTKEQGE